MTVPVDEIDWERVRRLTFVPFLHDGRCALIPAGHGLVLPSGEVLEGEDPMLDTGLRVPRVTAGFRRQGSPPAPPATSTRPRSWRRPTPPAGPWTRDRSRHPDRLLARLGFRVDGVTRPAQVPGRPQAPTAWIRRDPELPA